MNRHPASCINGGEPKSGLGPENLATAYNPEMCFLELPVIVDR